MDEIALNQCVDGHWCNALKCHYHPMTLCFYGFNATVNSTRLMALVQRTKWHCDTKHPMSLRRKTFVRHCDATHLMSQLLNDKYSSTIWLRLIRFGCAVRHWLGRAEWRRHRKLWHFENHTQSRRLPKVACRSMHVKDDVWSSLRVARMHREATLGNEETENAWMCGEEKWKME